MGRMDDDKYEQAQAFMNAGRYGEAIAVYNELIMLNPQVDSLRLALAWAYRDSGNVEMAISIFEALLEKELSRKLFTGFAFDELVRIFREKEDYRRLIGVCERAAAAQPEDVSILFTLGESYLSGGRAGDAVRVFQKITEMEPDASSAFCALGSALISMGEFDRAEDAFRTAGLIDPSDAGTYFNRLGNAYLNAGEYGRAQNAFREAIKCSAGQPLYYCNLGDALLKGGKIAEAEVAYEYAVRINPRFASAYYNRFGNSLARENRHLKAIDIFKKAIASDSRNPFLYLGLAQSYLAEGMIDLAEEACSTATTLEAGS
ncbi:MAG: tetratricopeptide repeat protein [Syntrophales bacterium]